MDELEQDAIQTDIYLDRLIASRGEVSPWPLPAEEQSGEPVRDAAALLRRTLVRFHPSFRFEEALASRLRAEGGTGPTGDSTDPTVGRLIPFPGSQAGPSSTDAVVALDRRGRGLLVGGAIASGVSIASIAGVVIWRRSRGGTGIHLAERLS